MGAVIRYADWMARSADSTPSGALLLAGPESYLRDQILIRVRERLFGGLDQARLGHDRFYGGDGPLSAVTSALASVGLFTGTRLVTLADPERCGRAGAAERRELAERLRGLQGGLQGSVFVAFSDLSVRELERKNEFCRQLLEVCQTIDLSHPAPADAMRWLLEESRRRRVRLDPEVGSYLLSRIGPDLQELSRELEKLELLVEPGETITIDEVREMVRRGQIGSGWELCEAILSGRTAEALRLWEAVSGNEPVLRFQWLLQRQVRARIARGVPPREAERLDRILQMSYQLERGIKTGRIASGKDGTALELVIASSGTGVARPVRKSG